MVNLVREFGENLITKFGEKSFIVKIKESVTVEDFNLDDNYTSYLGNVMGYLQDNTLYTIHSKDVLIVGKPDDSKFIGQFVKIRGNLYKQLSKRPTQGFYLGKLRNRFSKGWVSYSENWSLYEGPLNFPPSFDVSISWGKSYKKNKVSSLPHYQERKPAKDFVAPDISACRLFNAMPYFSRPYNSDRVGLLYNAIKNLPPNKQFFPTDYSKYSVEILTLSMVLGSLSPEVLYGKDYTLESFYQKSIISREDFLITVSFLYGGISSEEFAVAYYTTSDSLYSFSESGTYKFSRRVSIGSWVSEDSFTYKDLNTSFIESKGLGDSKYVTCIINSYKLLYSSLKSRIGSRDFDESNFPILLKQEEKKLGFSLPYESKKAFFIANEKVGYLVGNNTGCLSSFLSVIKKLGFSKPQDLYLGDEIDYSSDILVIHNADLYEDKSLRSLLTRLEEYAGSIYFVGEYCPLTDLLPNFYLPGIDKSYFFDGSPLTTSTKIKGLRVLPYGDAVISLSIQKLLNKYTDAGVSLNDVILITDSDNNHFKDLGVEVVPESRYYLADSKYVLYVPVNETLTPSFVLNLPKTCKGVSFILPYEKGIGWNNSVMGGNLYELVSKK